MAALRQPRAESKPQSTSVPPMADPSMLRLDLTKPKSSVHGERVPQDPQYNVAWWQDGLPFDIEGRLVPDDGQTGQKIIIVDGKPQEFPPLYSAQKREILRKKLIRLAKHVVDPEEDAVEVSAHKKELEDLEIDDVDLGAWIKGDRKYDIELIRAAIFKRYSRRVANTRDAVQTLVNEEEIILTSEVAPQYVPYLEKEAAV